MKFARTVEKPVWETGTDTMLKGTRGILGVTSQETVAPENLVPRLQELKYSPERPFPVLFDLTAIDESERLGRPEGETHRFTMQYLLFSPERRETHLIKVPLADSDNPSIHSATRVYKVANWYEREAYDMFGIRFEGHPNLTRILMPDWWKGHPLRKDHP